jgi:hypothetical protein
MMERERRSESFVLTASKANYRLGRAENKLEGRHV